MSAVLTIKRTEVAPMLALAKGDNGGGFTRCMGLTITHLEKMQRWFGLEEAAVSCNFTRETLSPIPGLFEELAALKGDVIAARLKGGE